MLPYTCRQILDFLGIPIEVHQFCDTTHKLVVSNHISELDPVVIIIALNTGRYRFITDIKVQDMPLVSTFAEILNVIYIERNASAIEKIRSNVLPTDNVCIFPEGTLYYKPMIERSNRYCRSKHIPVFQNVLAPRETGFNLVREILNVTKYTDITIKYIYPNNSFLRESSTPLTIAHLLANKPTKILVSIHESSRPITETFRLKDMYLSVFDLFQRWFI